MASRPDLPAEIRPFLEAIHGYVKRAVAVELDGSEESLAFVDHYIESTARKEASDARLGGEVIALLAPALGAYLGEVAIARFGGKWVLGDEGPVGWRVELDPAPLHFFPAGMAAEALRGGPVDDYDASFGTRADLTVPLEEAMAHAPPVDEAYFYSLTGRLETLTHALDLLVEIERKRREKQN